MSRATLFSAWLALLAPAVSGQQSEVPILAPAPPEASCARTVIACNTSLSSSIEETDCKISSGVHADVYGLELSDKLFVTILMDSPDLDSYLVFREERALQPIPKWSNRPLPITVQDDNGGGGTSSRVAVAAEPPGLWVLTAKGKKRGAHGQYTLTVKCEDVQ
jgi:hypothetical protein